MFRLFETRKLFLRSSNFIRRCEMSSNKIMKSKMIEPLLATDKVHMSYPKFIMEDYLSPSKCDLPAFTDGTTGEFYTFKQLHSHAYSFAYTLEQFYKIGKEDCVAIFSPNHINFHTVFLGVGLTQGFSMCINPLYTYEEALYQTELTNAKVIVAHPYCMKIAKQISDKMKIPLINMHIPLKEHGTENIPCVNDMIQTDIKLINIDHFGKNCDNDILSVPFSSGTSGRPKGVMLTHKSCLSNILQCMPAEGKYMSTKYNNGIRQSLLVPLPFFHIYGLIAGMFLPLYVGAQSVFMPSFDLIKYLEIIQKYKITRSHIVPPICLALAKHPIVDKYDLSSLKVLMSGAAPLGADVQAACSQRLKCLVKQAWGMTEVLYTYIYTYI